MNGVRWLILSALVLTLTVSVTYAGDTDPQPQTPVQHGPRFVDENGDGFNDLAPDHDGDGIPNGQDPDYVRPQDCSGSGQAWGGRGQGRRGGNAGQRGFVDANGDGICDNYGTGVRQGKGFGPRCRANHANRNTTMRGGRGMGSTGGSSN